MKRAKDISVAIGAHFKANREAAGLRQDEVARAAREGGLGWTRATVAAIETGKRDISLNEFFAIRGKPLQAGELDGKRGLFWYASQGRPIRGTAEQLDAEIKTARKLGVEPRAIVKASYRLWSRTLTDERDRIVEARVTFDRTAEEHYGKNDAPARSLQAHRGHVTRELVAQIKELLGAGSARIARKK